MVLEDAGVKTISSQALAEQFHLNAAQIRKDLAYFGEFGVRGVGYYVHDLKRHLRQILGLDRKLRVAIMGAGNLGLALAKQGRTDEAIEHYREAVRLQPAFGEARQHLADALASQAKTEEARGPASSARGAGRYPPGALTDPGRWRFSPRRFCATTGRCFAVS